MVAAKKKEAPASTYHWRPSFRDFESLPDQRVARARFFMPALFIGIAALFVGYLLFREYQAFELNNGIASLAAEIESYDEAHDEKVGLNGQFMKAVGTFDEIDAFQSDQISATELLLRLSANTPQGMYLTRIQYLNEGSATVEGRIIVHSEEASAVVNKFLDAIEAADVTQGRSAQYSLASMARSPQADSIDFRIEISGEEPTAQKKRRR